MTARPPIEDVFWANVLKTDGCWLWQGRVHSAGYGHLSVHGRPWFAHRFAYYLAHGDIPAGMYICHHCDVRLCVRNDAEAHIYLGTQQDNLRDMVRRQRHGAVTRPETVRRGEKGRAR